MSLPLPKSRRVYLFDQISQESAKTVVKEIKEITSNDLELIKLYGVYGLQYEPKPIELYIDSYGGQVYPMFGLCNVIEANPVPVNTIVTGCAMSAAFLVSVSGRKRYCHHNSRFMYHQTFYGMFGKIEDIKEDMKEYKRFEREMVEYVADRTKLTKKRILENDKIKKDWYFSSQEALDWGIVDEIL